MSKSTLLQAADESMNSLISWGIGGIILAVFVAPTFWIMVKTAQEREKKRGDRDEKEATERSDRERKLIDALVQSVEQQKQALEQWRSFELKEEQVHATLLNGFAQLTALIAAQQKAADGTANSQAQIAQLLDKVATRLGQQKNPA